MKSLQTIVAQAPLSIPPFRMDSFQQEILDNLHLEFFFNKCRFLITPSYGYLVTGEATPEEERALQMVLEERQTQLEKLKEYLLYSLALYSALLETNSYYIELNGHLVIARFIQLPAEADQYE